MFTNSHNNNESDLHVDTQANLEQRMMYARQPQNSAAMSISTMMGDPATWGFGDSIIGIRGNSALILTKQEYNRGDSFRNGQIVRAPVIKIASRTGVEMLLGDALKMAAVTGVEAFSNTLNHIMYDIQQIRQVEKFDGGEQAKDELASRVNVDVITIRNAVESLRDAYEQVAVDEYNVTVYKWLCDLIAALETLCDARSLIDHLTTHDIAPEFRVRWNIAEFKRSLGVIDEIKTNNTRAAILEEVDAELATSLAEQERNDAWNQMLSHNRELEAREAELERVQNRNRELEARLEDADRRERDAARARQSSRFNEEITTARAGRTARPDDDNPTARAGRTARLDEDANAKRVFKEGI